MRERLAAAGRQRRAMLLIALAMVLAASGVDAQSLLPPLVTCALTTYDAEAKGVISYDRHLHFVQRIPTMNQDYRFDSRRLRIDHALVAVKLYRKFDGKQVSSADALKSAQAELDSAPLQDELAKFPFNASAAADYAYTPVAAPSRASSTGTQFHVATRVRDELHGDGDIWIDAGSCHFERVVIAPSRYSQVLDPYHVTGQIVVRFAAVANGLNDVRDVKAHFVGHSGFVVGTIDYDEVYDAYTHYATREQGMQALSQAIPTGGSK